MLVYERPNRCSRGTGFTDEHDQNIQRSRRPSRAARAPALASLTGQPPGMLGRALYSYRAPPKSTNLKRPTARPTMADAAAAPARGDEVSTQRHSPP